MPAGEDVLRAGGELDAEEALARLGSRRDTYRRLLQRFVRTHAATPAELRQALASADVRGATLLVHTVGSAAANIGATRLYRAAVALEAALRVTTSTPPLQTRQDFEVAHQASLAEATAALGTTARAAPAAPPAMPLMASLAGGAARARTPGGGATPELVGAAIERLEGFLAQHDTSAVEGLQGLRDALGDAFGDTFGDAFGDDFAALEPMHQLEISVNDYDFEQARRDLEKLESILRSRGALRGAMAASGAGGPAR